jgi:hypothetical protein
VCYTDGVEEEAGMCLLLHMLVDVGVDCYGVSLRPLSSNLDLPRAQREIVLRGRHRLHLEQPGTAESYENLRLD